MRARYSLLCLGIFSNIGLSQDADADLSSKRGLAYQGDDHEADNELLTSDDSPISWYYTWSLWPAEQIGDSAMFVPMIHGIDDATDNGLEGRLNDLPDSSTHVLTFNEPDGETDTGGSSISPEDAAEAYIENIVPLRDSGARRWAISHPVVTGSPMGLDWLRDFNESCYDIDEDNGCPTDFVAVHWYGDAAGLQSWMGTLREFYGDMAPDARFWVTEMAIPQVDEEETLAMMNESIQYLDEEDSVEAYAWFGAFRTDDANEWTGDGVSFFDDDGGLTEVGTEYLGGEENGFEEGMSGEVKMERLAVQDLQLRDGTLIPKCTSVGVIPHGRHFDPGIPPNATKFDTFHDAKVREEAGMENQFTFGQASPDNLLFGLGRHACPGRHFASVLIKLVLVHILINYDIKFIEGQPAPQGKWTQKFRNPDFGGAISWKARSDEEKTQFRSL